MPLHDVPISCSGDIVLPGEGYLVDTPVLRSHAGTQPDLFLRWNEIPVSADAIDVAVHLHGFSQQGDAMPLAEKVGRSGLGDFLVLGHAFLPACWASLAARRSVAAR